MYYIARAKLAVRASASGEAERLGDFLGGDVIRVCDDTARAARAGGAGGDPEWLRVPLEGAVHQAGTAGVGYVRARNRFRALVDHSDGTAGAAAWAAQCERRAEGTAWLATMAVGADRASGADADDAPSFGGHAAYP